MAETEQTASTENSQANGQSPWASPQAVAEQDPFARHPELYVGAALLGGLVLAQVLKRLGGDD